MTDNVIAGIILIILVGLFVGMFMLGVISSAGKSNQGREEEKKNPRDMLKRQYSDDEVRHLIRKSQQVVIGIPEDEKIHQLKAIREATSVSLKEAIALYDIIHPRRY